MLLDGLNAAKEKVSKKKNFSLWNQHITKNRSSKEWKSLSYTLWKDKSTTSFPVSLVFPPCRRGGGKSFDRAGRWETLGTRFSNQLFWIAVYNGQFVSCSVRDSYCFRWLFDFISSFVYLLKKTTTTTTNACMVLKCSLQLVSVFRNIGYNMLTRIDPETLQGPSDSLTDL